MCGTAQNTDRTAEELLATFMNGLPIKSRERNKQDTCLVNIVACVCLSGQLGKGKSKTDGRACVIKFSLCVIFFSFFPSWL